MNRAPTAPAPDASFLRRHRAAAIAAACVLVFGLAWAGRSAWGGWFLFDPSPGHDVYHLATIYDRWGHHLRQGHVALWFPEFSAGYPAPAAWMYGLLYPGNLLFALLPPESAWTWTALLHLALGAAGMCRLVEDETSDAAAGIVAGLVFGLSEFAFARTMCGHINLVLPLAWAPWVLLHLARAARGAPGSGARAALCLAAGMLAGHVQVWFYVAPFAALLSLRGCLTAADRRAAWTQTTIAAVLAVLMTSVQWLPTLELVSTSAPDPPSDANLAAYSAPLHVLAAKLFPGVLGPLPETLWTSAGICGLLLVPLSFAALAAGSKQGWRRWFGAGCGFWLLVAVAGLLLAPGVLSTVTAALNRIPPFGWGRTPGRALLLTVIGASAVAGHGLAAWRLAVAGPREAFRRLVAMAAAATVLAAAAGLAVLASARDGTGLAGGLGVTAPAVAASVIVAAALLAVLACALRTRFGAAAACAVVVAGAALGGVPSADVVSARFFHVDWASALPHDAALHRVHQLDFRFPNVETQGVPTFRSVCPVDARWFVRFFDGAGPARAAWFDLRAELAPIPDARMFAPDDSAERVGPADLIARPVAGIGAGLVFEEAGAAPEPVTIRTLDLGARVLDLADPPAPPVGGRRAGPTDRSVERIRSGDPDRAEFRVGDGPAGWLVVSEKYFPGWTAKVDGAAVEIRRANVALRAVRVPAGACSVVMRYEPWTARLGRIVAGAALVAACVLLVRGARGRAGAVM